MKCLLLIPLLSFAAFADDSEATKKIDAQLVQSCELAKKNAAGQPKCHVENRQLSALDCSDKAARTRVDFLKLNVECTKKARNGAAKKTATKDVKASDAGAQPPH